jgi:hypothetical protein
MAFIPLVTLKESLGTITLDVNALPVHFSMEVSVFDAFPQEHSATGNSPYLLTINAVAQAAH